MFIGRDLPKDIDKTIVKFGYVDITTNLYKFTKFGIGALPTNWSTGYDKDSGILTLHMEMSGLSDDFNLIKPIPNTKPPTSLGQLLCQPASMCTWNNTNGCTRNPNNPYAALCNQQNQLGHNVCDWSVQDIDCPARGCFSFQITFPNNFSASGVNERPTKSPYLIKFSADTNFKWNVPFGLPGSDITTTQCNYTSQPGPGSRMTSR